MPPRLAAEEINYRRFFDVADLVGLRVEEPRVFAARHRGRDVLANGPRSEHADAREGELAAER